MMWHTFSQPLGIQFVATCFTSGGILERFPELKVVSVESGAGWIPYLLEGLEYMSRESGLEYGTPPSEVTASTITIASCLCASCARAGGSRGRRPA